MVKGSDNFHRLIEPEDKEKLSKILDIIQKSLEIQGYTPKKYIREAITVDGGRNPIKCMKSFVSKDSSNYRIEVQMLD